MEITRCIFDLSRFFYEEIKIIFKVAGVPIFLLLVSRRHLILEFKQHSVGLGFDKLPSDTFYWLFQKNVTRQPAPRTLSDVRVKFGKCTPPTCPTRTQLHKIHPPRIGLIRVPETAERFVGRDIRLQSIHASLQRQLYNITSPRISTAVTILLNFFSSL